MRNPLNKRLPRELKSEFGKYMVILLLMITSIGLVSGFLVADNSMIAAYDDGFFKYNIEDGHFITDNPLNKPQKQRVEQENAITLYEMPYAEENLTNDTELRIYALREEVNKLCLMEGEMPAGADEIAIDRMYADNNNLSVGDILKSAEHSWHITGFVAFSDYSCLFSSNNDSMFDAQKFGVAVVTADMFAQYDTTLLTNCYAWKYADAPCDEMAEHTRAEDLMEDINSSVHLKDFVPRYENKAITFTGEDMGSDKAMMIALLYIIIAIMAFVFGVTTSDTISKEANVIGTLRASGYTRRELICHYIEMPTFVTLLSALWGNILGYTFFKDFCAGLYYGSYSLPTYITIWNSEAFWLTTAVPVVLTLCINVVVLYRKLTLSPLKFLRHDLSRKKQGRAIRLSPKLKFFGRFRLRVVFQNAGNYAILFVGILFANLLLLFGLIFPSILEKYQEDMPNNLLCEYQYILKVPLDALDEEHILSSLMSGLDFKFGAQTQNQDAEKFSAYELETPRGSYPSETVSFYGVELNSRYIETVLHTEDVYISSAYADKFGIKIGDSITLNEKYEDKQYTFTVTGIYDYMGAIAVFMNRTEMNQTFDLDSSYYCGYLSDTPITDIDEKYIASVITLDDLTKISRQLMISMGGMMNMVSAFSMLIFIVLVYLLSKIILEKNAQSISMTKILGYSDTEISRLYILSTTTVVIIFLLISLPIENTVMYLLFQKIMMSMISGWIPYELDPLIPVQMFAMGLMAYAVVAVLEYRKIKKIPMDRALKNVE